MRDQVRMSWKLLGNTLHVLVNDPEILFFSILSQALTGIICLALFLLTPLATLGYDSWILQDLALPTAAGIFAIAYVSVFFRICIANTARIRFQGGNATFFQSLGFALGRSVHIAFLSLLILLISILVRTARLGSVTRFGRRGAIFAKILTSVGGIAFEVIGFFVIPVMTYERIGPLAAIRTSIQTVRDVWGETAISYIGLTVIRRILDIFIVLIAFVAAVYLYTRLAFTGYEWVAYLAFAVIFGLYINFFATASQIYYTALYHYARTGQAPQGYSEAEMQNAIQGSGTQQSTDDGRRRPTDHNNFRTTYLRRP
ncbi:MAG: hypothetical protein HC945_02320 [Nitrosarchaeum sp.]|nr:hypothetical protein [Nitrosarchaeum sp.]